MGKTVNATDFIKQVQEDLNAVCRARAVENDPKRMADVKRLAAFQLQENEGHRLSIGGVS